MSKEHFPYVAIVGVVAVVAVAVLLLSLRTTTQAPAVEVAEEGVEEGAAAEALAGQAIKKGSLGVPGTSGKGPTAKEVCDGARDEDKDGKVDCADKDCVGNKALCTNLADGKYCALKSQCASGNCEAGKCAPIPPPPPAPPGWEFVVSSMYVDTTAYPPGTLLPLEIRIKNIGLENYPEEGVLVRLWSNFGSSADYQYLSAGKELGFYRALRVFSSQSLPMLLTAEVFLVPADQILGIFSGSDDEQRQKGDLLVVGKSPVTQFTILDTKIRSTCGNSQLDTGESCDGNLYRDLNNDGYVDIWTDRSCGWAIAGPYAVQNHRYNGTVSCNPGCSRDLSECEVGCGNGNLEYPELCDGTLFYPTVNGCEDLGSGGYTGTLGCDNNCVLDTSKCVPSTS